MIVLSVHLATRSWRDLGVALLRSEGTGVACEILPWQGDEAPTVVELAQRLNEVCRQHGATVLMLDGPQAWKADDNGFPHSRVAERALNTAAKMGAPGVVLPGTYERFVGYCLALYEALARLGWRRLMTGQRAAGQQCQRFLVESYPQAAWKSLGIRPLPARRRCRVSDLAEAWAALTALVPVSANQPPNHNQMQAIVGGLPGLALATDLMQESEAAAFAGWQTGDQACANGQLSRHRTAATQAVGVRIVGQPPRQEGGHWREGFIAVPIAPPTDRSNRRNDSE